MKSLRIWESDSCPRASPFIGHTDSQRDRNLFGLFLLWAAEAEGLSGSFHDRDTEDVRILVVERVLQCRQVGAAALVECTAQKQARSGRA